MRNSDLWGILRLEDARWNEPDYDWAAKRLLEAAQEYQVSAIVETLSQAWPTCDDVPGVLRDIHYYRGWCPNEEWKQLCSYDYYVVLCETPHGSRYWRGTSSPDCENDVKVTIGPTLVGVEGYPDEDEAIENLFGLSEYHREGDGWASDKPDCLSVCLPRVTGNPEIVCEPCGENLHEREGYEGFVAEWRAEDEYIYAVVRHCQWCGTELR